eukprot:gnl/TRDRNA2_/TRDRNA2_132643_c0_seq1.p1 gnl/TRDRNA2_/TRDRNA2_132643_c0~~gnl/TRDRNA2_/TRDRNA2_132643_c0_seq1.p1  ORF type:complete len:120 (-),score=33.53 gnl/TRDRNA2_/TRDRNA2_132643_c0_seq1:119-454(-)
MFAAAKKETVPDNTLIASVDTGIPCKVILGHDICNIRGRAECVDSTCLCKDGYHVEDGGHTCAPDAMLAAAEAGFPWTVMLSSMLVGAVLTAVVIRRRRGSTMEEPLLQTY